MPRHALSAPGAPIWLDLASSDPARAVDFYTSVFGWEPQYSGPEFNDYVTFLHSGERIAGLGRVEPGQPDAWLIYLASLDVDATASAVVAAGGTLLFTHTVGELGRTMRAVDPSGAPIAAWQPNTHTGFAFDNEPGAPAWFELHTDDFAAAVRFYEHVFGWTVDVLSDTDEFRMVTAGRPSFAGIVDAGSAVSREASHWMPYLHVADTDATVASALELGGTQVTPAADTPFGRMSAVADPMGGAFRIIQSRQE